MNKILKARLDQLDNSLSNAVVEVVDKDEGIFSVFVPGAPREQNTVKAEGEQEAIDKVRSVLTSKIKDHATKPTPTGENQELDVQGVKQETTAGVAGGSE